VHRDEPGFDAPRTVENSMVDRRPALIVRPTETDDVVAAASRAWRRSDW
jgi:hypothetical protein